MFAKHKLNVFISYRRDDSSGNAGRLFDWLARDFGRENIFLDTDKIAGGEEFARVLAERLKCSDVLLAVIGKQWLNIADENGRRLDQPDDFVRIEITTALDGGVRVIPVLVGGALMPDEESLPTPLKRMAKLNAIAVRDAGFEQDFDLLLDDMLGRPRGYVRREYDRLRRLFVAIEVSALLAPVLVAVVVLGLWLGVLDRLALNTGAATHLLNLAETIAPPRMDPGVLLIKIDETTHNELNRPFEPSAEWRRDYAKLIDRAAAAGATAVVFDLFMERPSNADQVLADAVRRARASPAATRVVFGVRALEEGKPRLPPALRDIRDWGSVCLKRPLGHNTYSAPLAVLQDASSGRESVPARIPALALTASFGGHLSEVDISRRLVRLSAPQPTRLPRFTHVERIRYGWGDCDTMAVGDDVAMLKIQPAPAGYWQDAARSVSFADALRRESLPDDRLRDRILLVGATLPRHDERLVDAGFSSRPVYGVELHADAIAALRTGREIVTPPLGTSAVIMLFATIAGACAGYAAATWRRTHRVLLLTSIIITYLAAAVAIASRGVLINVLYDLTAFLVAYAALRHLRLGGFEKT